MYSIETRRFGKIKKTEFNKNQVHDLHLQDKLSKQKFHEDIAKLYEPLTDTIKKTSEDLTKSFTETSVQNNQAIPDLIEKVFELMKDEGVIAPFLASSLVNHFKPEN